MFFDARGDTPEVLDPVEEAFDVVALLIENLGEAVTMLAVNPVGCLTSAPLGHIEVFS